MPYCGIDIVNSVLQFSLSPSQQLTDVRRKLAARTVCKLSTTTILMQKSLKLKLTFKVKLTLKPIRKNDF